MAEQEVQSYPPVEAPVMLESEFDMESIEHFGALIMQIVQDDPMFQEKYGKRINESWHPAQVSEKLAQRLILRSIIEQI